MESTQARIGRKRFLYVLELISVLILVSVLRRAIPRVVFPPAVKGSLNDGEALEPRIAAANTSEVFYFFLVMWLLVMQPAVGIIGGSGFYSPEMLMNVRAKAKSTPFGEPSAEILIGDSHGRKVAFLARHGKRHRYPAHRVNHRANLWAMHELGISRIIATSSVGSMKEGIEPGSFVVPEDFVSFWKVPTFFEEETVHATPRLDQSLREGIITACKRLNLVVHDRGTYVETLGPRLETRAEIRILSNYGEVVGMTMASEATLASELEIGYACLCTVDNYANGITDEPLTYDMIRKVQLDKSEKLREIMSKVLEEF